MERGSSKASADRANEIVLDPAESIGELWRPLWI
jgi:hypothetical protein